MTTDEVLAVVADRGLEIAVEGDKLALRGPNEGKTPALLRTLKIHREAIVARYRSAQPAPEPQDEPEPDLVATAEPMSEGGGEDEGPWVCPFWVVYLWGTGHTRTYRADRPPPLAAWWWRMGGPGITGWEPLPDCPAGFEIPKEVAG